MGRPASAISRASIGVIALSMRHSDSRTSSSRSASCSVCTRRASKRSSPQVAAPSTASNVATAAENTSQWVRARID